MPIRPENKGRYPANWKEIREGILKRANNHCEICGVPNYFRVIRFEDSIRWEYPQWWFYREYVSGCRHAPEEYLAEQIIGSLEYRDDPYREAKYRQARLVKIVLTIAHLDHTPEHCEPENLKALCQLCHLSYDAKRKARDLMERRRTARAIGEIFG
jgi:hypothetical protein